MALFSANEIVQLGIQIEKNGREFYLEVAKNSKSPQAKETFNYLAGEELKHEKVFEAMLAVIGKYEPQENTDKEYSEYLTALSKEHVFTEKNTGRTTAAGVKNDLQAIELAIGFEKDSILLFYEMKNLVSADGHPTVDKLIQQEQEHLLKLTQLKGEYKN